MNTKTGNRILSLMLAVVMTVCAILPVVADDVIIDWVLYTNVRTFINSVEISSFNIKGYTAVVVEDLAEYGFDVVWDGATATLSAARNFNKAVTGAVVETVKGGEPGERAMPVYATNIKTYFDGELFESYNVGGRTIVYMDALAEMYAADYVWDGSTSKLSAEWKSGTQQKMVTNKGTVTVEDAKGNYNLTELGTTDWFIPTVNDTDDGNYYISAAMKWLPENYISTGITDSFGFASTRGKLSLQYFDGNTDVRQSFDNYPITFSFNDSIYFEDGTTYVDAADGVPGGWELSPGNGKIGNLTTPCGFEIKVAASDRPQTLTVFSGAWEATARFTISAGDEVIESRSFNAGKDLVYKRFTVTVEPNTSITFRAELTSITKKNGSVYFGAYALNRNETKQELAAVSATIEKLLAQGEKVQELNALIDKNGTLFEADSADSDSYYYYSVPLSSNEDTVYTMCWEHFPNRAETYLGLFETDADGYAGDVLWIELGYNFLDPVTLKGTHFVEYFPGDGSDYCTEIDDSFPYSTIPFRQVATNSDFNALALKDRSRNTAGREVQAVALTMLQYAMSNANVAFGQANWDFTLDDFGFTNHN